MSNKGNKSAREMLEKIYGKKCMIHEGIRALKPPKLNKVKYRGKSIAFQLTYHHLKAKRFWGKSTLENGACICRSCHDWLEQLSEAERELVNDELREYKRKIDMNKIPSMSIAVTEITTDGVEQAKLIRLEESENVKIIPAYDTTPEDRVKYQEYLIEKRKRELSKDKWKNLQG